MYVKYNAVYISSRRTFKYGIQTKLEEHSVERITSDKGRYPTAQLICVFVVLDLDL